MRRAALLLLLGIATSLGCATADVDDAAGGESAINSGGEPIGPKAKFPIVLVHGFTGSNKVWNFVGVVEALTKDGHKVYAPELMPFGTPDVNAEMLHDKVEQILKETNTPRVHVIAHSKGGFDARAFASKYPKLVASVTTVTAPNHGTAIADFAVSALDPAWSHALLPDGVKGSLDKLRNGTLGIVEGAWTGFFSPTHFKESGTKNDILQTLKDISEKNAAAWNAAHPDASGVYYQSWAGVSFAGGVGLGADYDAQIAKQCKVSDGVVDFGYMTVNGQAAPKDVMDAKLVPVAAITSHAKSLHPIPNDGMATIASAKWGTFRGCLPADHQDDVGRSETPAGQDDSRSGFNHVRFFRQVAFDLAKNHELSNTVE